jgi:ribosomal protein S18 acetylase RimI-like enzyme
MNAPGDWERRTILDLETQWAANRRFWAGWASSAPDADFAIYRSGIPHALFNGVLRTRDVALDDAVADALVRLAGIPWVWWVGGDSDEGVAEGLVARGAEPAGSLPIMALDLTELQDAPLPDGLAMREITDRAAVAEFVSAYAGPLNLSPAAAELVAAREFEYLSRDSQLIHVAGLVDRTTVGTAVVSLGGDVAALYCIATAEGFRGRGIATAVTVEALKVARDAGLTVATLQSSAAGRPVYERIGFQTVSHYRLFAFPSTTDGAD